MATKKTAAKKKSAKRSTKPRKKPTGAAGGSGEVRVIVEMKVSPDQPAAAAMAPAAALAVPGFSLDGGFEPIPVAAPPAQASAMEAAFESTVVVRGTVPNRSAMKALERQSNVFGVWEDTLIAPFDASGEFDPVGAMAPMAGACPIPPCDCTPSTPKGTINDVANYLGVDQIWAKGHRGQGVIIGVVDGGITAQGRTINIADTGHVPNPNCPLPWPNKLISRVVGGWPAANWGTTGVAWCWHGNMSATDALGMAPQAQLYDIRISDGNAISQALAGFQWAIGQFKAGNGPHILTNSWGIFQEAWDTVYATNPNHPFTRKVVEALDEGILVLFAAGNCGNTCPSGRCGGDTGPGRSIWGANGHPRVMTVGAANRLEQFIGYSSQGPAALDPNKPDFCSISHFTGFYNSDNGTSAACPIAAGVVALLKGAKPALTQATIKAGLKAKAKNIGPAGWDQHSGSGIIQAKATYDHLVPTPIPRCGRERARALRYRALYRRTRNRRYLCLFYRAAAIYFRCMYRATGNRRYLCRFYRYASRYYCCLYRLTRNRRYLDRCRRYYAAYRRCR